MMGLGNKAVKVKVGDCEKMVSANLPLLLTLTRLLMRFGKIVHFFYYCTKEYKRNHGPVALKFPIIKFLISIIIVNFV